SQLSTSQKTIKKTFVRVTLLYLIIGVKDKAEYTLLKLLFRTDTKIQLIKFYLPYITFSENSKNQYKDDNLIAIFDNIFIDTLLLIFEASFFVFFHIPSSLMLARNK